MPMRIHYACNDYRNGNDLGRAGSIQIDLGDGDVLVSLVGTPVKTDCYPVPDGHILQIGRIKIPALGYRNWVGNWCWDACPVRAIYALQVFNYLMSLKYWHCEEGRCELYDRFNAKKPLTGQEWRDLLA